MNICRNLFGLCALEATAFYGLVVLYVRLDSNFYLVSVPLIPLRCICSQNIPSFLFCMVVIERVVDLTMKGLHAFSCVSLCLHVYAGGRTSRLYVCMSVYSLGPFCMNLSGGIAHVTEGYRFVFTYTKTYFDVCIACLQSHMHIYIYIYISVHACIDD